MSILEKSKLTNSKCFQQDFLIKADNKTAANHTKSKRAWQKIKAYYPKFITYIPYIVWIMVASEGLDYHKAYADSINNPNNMRISDTAYQKWINAYYDQTSIDLWQELDQIHAAINLENKDIQKNTHNLPTNLPTYRPSNAPLEAKDGFELQNSVLAKHDDVIKLARSKKIIEGSTLHRKVVDANLYPWSAIGRINVVVSMSVRLHCTGALISERVVLTAAHCLYVNGLDKWANPKMIHFVAGFQRGDYLTSSTGVKIIKSDQFKGKAGANANNLANDWALLVLKDPIGRDTGYLGWKNLSKREVRNLVRQKNGLALAGYPRDRKQVISLDDNCELAGFFRDERLLAHRCKILNGDSGAPIGILDQDGNFTVVAVNSAASEDHYGNNLNTAIPTNSFSSQLTALLEELDDASLAYPLLDDNAKTIGHIGQIPVSGIPSADKAHTQNFSWLDENNTQNNSDILYSEVSGKAISLLQARIN